MCHKWGRQTLKLAPPSLFVVFTPLGNLLPLSVGRTCEWLRANRIWQRWWDVTFVVMLHTIVMFVMLTDSLLCCLWPGDYAREEFRGTFGWELARNWGLQSNLPRIWILPTTTWAWKWNLPQSSREALSPGKLFDINLLRSWSRRLSWATPRISTHEICDLINACYFKPLNFW